MKTEYEDFDRWMIDYMAGCLPEEELQGFHALLKSDEYYQKRFKELSKEHARLLIPHFAKTEVDNYEKLLHRLNVKKGTHSLTLSPRWVLWRNVRRIAATVALLITSSVACYYIWDDIQRSTQDVVLCQMEVPLGSHTKVVLPDGSVVCLNSGSVLKYDPAFTRNKNREVYLVGEGYFEVHKNPEKPFIVHTEGLNVKVLGTVFNVRAYKEEPNIEVALVEGKVNVFSKSETTGNVVLKPNQRAVYDKQSGRLLSDVVDAEIMTQWTTGRLSFVNTSLVDIMKDIERKFNVRIDILSECMKSEIFSGSISTKLSLDEILDYLDVDDKYEWERKGNVITITNK
ncbi:FecR family protein [Bacteroides sp.]|uniref:FecR family protein n=1 Tax=Bacteroides sp. TaxID=29523 RepID=UPI002626E04B|nr:FecR domain-containing protein [Bacteroides sp.]